MVIGQHGFGDKGQIFLSINNLNTFKNIVLINMV